MRTALAIAAAELRLYRRSRLALVGLLTLVLLSAIAAITSAAQTSAARAVRAEAQAAADAQFAAQPDRHPHRMSHYGTYALRGLGPFAGFDPGVDAFTGTVLFLEAHRQNSATFGAVDESSDLIRFGQLTPAFVLQALAPLLLIFLGHSGVAREREMGTLVALRAHGAGPAALIGGKALALALVAALALLPALATLAWGAIMQPGEAGIAALIGLAYTLYLGAWVMLVAALSGLSRTAQGALLALLALWTVTTVLVPRAAAAWAGLSLPLPGRAETELVIHAELRRIGDSHNPDDPYFARFKADVLRRHGVSRVEDLPFNYRGLVSAEGERLTSALFRDHAAATAAHQQRQLARLAGFGWISPALAVRRASMTGAATDLATHIAFLDAAEAYRYDLVQRLNRLHTEQVAASDDAARSKDPLAERRSRISADFWRTLPRFAFAPRPAAARAADIGLALLPLLAWVAGAGALMLAAARRLERGR